MSDTSTPSISIITVTAFDIERLKVTLDSILGSAAYVQFIIICPKNDHETISFLHEFIQKNSIKLTIGHDNNLGIYKAMNIGAELATGEYLIYWNSGDYCVSTSNLKKLNEELKREKPVWGLFQGKFNWRDQQSLSEINLKNFCLQRGGYISHQTVFVSRRIFLILGGYDETYKVAADSKIIIQFWLSYTCLFFNSLIVEVDPPNFSAINHRIARLESLKTSFQVLTGLAKFIAIGNIIAREFIYLWNKLFMR
jgi:glycosyltransferase involved in cell wall biosynthesis